MAKKYWLKLHEHYFQEDEILFLSALPNGEKYILFWIRLLLKCLKASDDTNCGFLRLTDKIPYTDELLAKALDTDIDTVRVSMKYFLQLGMVKTLSDGTLYIEEVQKLIGRECDSAERVRKHRAKMLQLEDNKQKLLQSNTDEVTSSPNINKEVEKEEEIDIKSNPQKTKYADSVSMFESEYEKLVKEHGPEVIKDAIEKLDAYKQSSGKRYKSDAAALRTWAIKQALKDKLEMNRLQPKTFESIEERRQRECREASAAALREAQG